MNKEIEDLNNKIKMINTNMKILIVFIMFLFFFYWLIFDYPHVKYTEEISKITLKGSDILEYPKSAIILCEDNSLIKQVGDTQTIYGCLSIDKENGKSKCHGEGKTCIIKTKKRI